METKLTLMELLIALLVIFNFGLLARLVSELIGCIDNDDKDPKKIAVHYFMIAISVNGISGIVALIKQYFE